MAPTQDKIILFLTGPQAPQILTPDDFGFVSRITVGGDSNRWLNISSVVVVVGAEDPDSKIFMCEVCQNRSTPAEECYTANYTSQIIGAPPYIINGTSPRKLSKKFYNVGVMYALYNNIRYPDCGWKISIFANILSHALISKI